MKTLSTFVTFDPWSIQRLLSDTISNTSAFWTAASAIATVTAVLVAIVLPWLTARRLRRAGWKRAEVILEPLCSEAMEVYERVDEAQRMVIVALASLRKANELNQLIEQGRADKIGTIQMPVYVDKDPVFLKFSLTQSAVDRLCEVADIGLVIWPNLRSLATELDPAHAEIIVGQFSYGERTGAKLMELVGTWQAAPYITITDLENYNRRIGPLLASFTQLVLYLFQVTGQPIPEQLRPEAMLKKMKWSMEVQHR